MISVTLRVSFATPNTFRVSGAYQYCTHGLARQFLQRAMLALQALY